MIELDLDKAIGNITLRELREVIKEVIKEELRREYYIDDEGYLIFLKEEAYSNYLKSQKGKLPSEIKARFIDDQGYMCIYSDWEFKAKKVKEIEKIKDEPLVEGEKVWERLRNLRINI